MLQLDIQLWSARRAGLPFHSFRRSDAQPLTPHEPVRCALCIPIIQWEPREDLMLYPELAPRHLIARRSRCTAIYAHRFEYLGFVSHLQMWNVSAQ